MTFQIEALPADDFHPLFQLSDDALKERLARRMVVAESPGVPCRVSLQDAQIGETVLLINYTHQAALSPYRASHAIFVRENAAQACPAPGEIPAMIRIRLISVRGFDACHAMIATDVVDGTNLEPLITDMFSDPAIHYIHLHNAKPGCYAARVRRA